MKVSIIVPVYNAEKYLHQCLDSLVGQTLDEYEIILIDDGSKDSSAAIMEEYKSRYPQRIQTLHVENGGQGRARNIGIGLAKGEYLGFVDSDDWVDLSMFQTLYEAAAAEEADMVICDVIDRYIDDREVVHHTWQETRPLAAAGSSCNKLFKREAVGEIRFPEGLWYEDFSFSARLIAKAEKVIYVPAALYIYRCGHASTMNNNNALKNLDILKIMDGIEDCIVENCGQDDFEYLVINHVLLDSINRLSFQSGQEKRQVIKALRAYVKKKIPSLPACRSFGEETRNRRIIMRMNYMGLDSLAGSLLKWKKALK